MHTIMPPKLETFDHWPSWLNARGHLDRSACFELKVSDLRRIAGCIPLQTGKYGKRYRARGREKFAVPDLPNEQDARNGKGRLTVGSYNIVAYDLDDLARQQYPRRLCGDWRTGRAPAMRPSVSQPPAMSATQGGYGPGSYAYERKTSDGVLDRELTANPNRGASREKRFGLDDDWSQRLGLEKWTHASVSGVQYFLICPGPAKDLTERSAGLTRSTVDAKGLKGLTGTTSNCGDGSKGAHDKGWVCGQRVYKLFWVLAREGEVRDALFAEQWLASLDSHQLARQSAAVSAHINRYGPIMGDDRMLRCRRCLRLRYGQSPEVLRKKRATRR